MTRSDYAKLYELHEALDAHEWHYFNADKFLSIPNLNDGYPTESRKVCRCGKIFIADLRIMLWYDMSNPVDEGVNSRCLAWVRKHPEECSYD